MNIQTLTHRLQAEGLRLTAHLTHGEYRCNVSRGGEPIASSTDPTLHGAVMSALYAAPMAHFIAPATDVELVLS